MRGMEYNFMKYSLAKINHLGAKYDTCSVMHYGAYAFSRVRRKNACTAFDETEEVLIFHQNMIFLTDIFFEKSMLNDL